MNDQPIRISFAPEPAKPHRARRAIVVVLATAVLVGLAGTAAFAWQRLSGGGTQPDEVLPASTVAFVRFDADPSAGQKIALLKLIRKFPEAAKSVGLTSPDQDVRKLLLKDAVSDCDLDYDEDVKPWLGHRFGFGLLDKTFKPVVAIQVTDEARAKTGIPMLLECNGESDPGVAFLDGYAIVTEKKVDAADAVAAARRSPLSENSRYAADIEALGDEGVFSAWYDAAATEPALKEFFGGEVPRGFDLGDVGRGTGAMTIRAASDAVELNIVSRNPVGSRTAKPVTRLADLPTDTVVALAMGGLGDAGATLYDTLIGGVAQSGGSADEVSDYLTTTFGLDPSKDLETLLGDGLTLAVGSTNIDKVSSMDPSQISTLDVSLAMQSEPGKATELARRLAALAKTADISLVVEPTGDGAVLATNEKAAKGSGGLGAESRFRTVIPDAANAQFGFYLDFAAVLDAISAAGPPPDLASIIDELRVLSAFGISSSVPDDEGYLHTNATLAFAE